MNWIMPEGLGADIFGEENTAQIRRTDWENRFLRDRYLGDYMRWHYELRKDEDPQMVADFQKIKMDRYKVAGWTAFGVLFAWVFWNPNMTMRRSNYIKKFNAAIFGTIGYAWGNKRREDHVFEALMHQYDYFPFAVRRTLASKDHRYMVGLSHERIQRDVATGKTLN